jgi:hypothetical protein
MSALNIVEAMAVTTAEGAAEEITQLRADKAELLEALKEIRQCLNAITAPGEFKEELARARAAIARAEASDG